MTFESPQRSIKCLFLQMEKIIAMVCFLSPQLMYKKSILYYKVVMIIINAFDVTEVVLNIVICHHSFPSLIVMNSNALYPLKAEYCYAMFYKLDAVFLPHFISKPAALPKGQIIINRAYFYVMVNPE